MRRLMLKLRDDPELAINGFIKYCKNTGPDDAVRVQAMSDNEDWEQIYASDVRLNKCCHTCVLLTFCAAVRRWLYDCLHAVSIHLYHTVRDYVRSFSLANGEKQKND